MSRTPPCRALATTRRAEGLRRVARWAGTLLVLSTRGLLAAFAAHEEYRPRRSGRSVISSRDQRQESASCRGEHDHEPRGRSGEGEKSEGGQGQGEIARTADRARPHGLIKGSEQEPDHRRVDSAEGALKGGSRAESVPEGQRSHDQEEGGEEDGHEGDGGARQTVGPRAPDRAEVGGEGEERTGHGLGRAIARDELLAGDPARGNDFRLEEGKHDVA